MYALEGWLILTGDQGWELMYLSCVIAGQIVSGGGLTCSAGLWGFFDCAPFAKPQLCLVSKQVHVMSEKFTKFIVSVLMP